MWQRQMDVFTRVPNPVSIFPHQLRPFWAIFPRALDAVCLDLEKDASIIALVEALGASMQKDSWAQPSCRNSTSYFLCLLFRSSRGHLPCLDEGNILAIAS